MAAISTFLPYQFESYLMDAGVLAVNVLSTPLIIAQSRGGLTFQEGKQVRVPEIDGISTPIAGTHRVVRYDSKIVGKVVIGAGASIVRLLPGGASDGSSPRNVITPVDARSFIAQGSLLANVGLVHRRSDGKGFMAFLYYGFVAKLDQAEGADNNEVVWDIEIQAALPTTASPNDPPFLYYELLG